MEKSNTTEYKFLQQQGYPEIEQEDPGAQFRPLQFQPAIVSTLMLLAIALQSPGIFFAVGAVLWINVFFPGMNIFELFFNRFLADRLNLRKIYPAPNPRRFAQGMAAMFMSIAGTGIMAGWHTIAYASQTFIVIAFSLLLFGKFCLGAYIYQLLLGRTRFANETCPWNA